jgi:hypothetical protein
VSIVEEGRIDNGEWRIKNILPVYREAAHPTELMPFDQKIGGRPEY